MHWTAVFSLLTLHNNVSWRDLMTAVVDFLADANYSMLQPHWSQWKCDVLWPAAKIYLQSLFIKILFLFVWLPTGMSVIIGWLNLLTLQTSEAFFHSARMLLWSCYETEKSCEPHDQSYCAKCRRFVLALVQHTAWRRYVIGYRMLPTNKRSTSSNSNFIKVSDGEDYVCVPFHT